MAEFEPDKLDRTGSRFARVIVAAKRARQIKDGARTLVESRSANVLTVALDEILVGEIIPLQVEEPEPLPTSVPPSPVIGGLLSTSVDDDLLDLTTGKHDSILPLTDEDEEDEDEDAYGAHDLEEDLVVTPVADDLAENDADALEVDEEDVDEDDEALDDSESPLGGDDAEASSDDA
jgi:DNA-directed RNA polymerase subunit omega